MEDYNKHAEENLLEMKKQKEEADRRLLRLEIFLGALGLIILLSLCIVASYVEMQDWLRGVLIGIGFLIFLPIMLVCLKIEQVAGYYECAKCHKKFVPTYKQINLSMHMGRTRFMKCPHCNNKSWCKKVVSEKEEK